MLISCGFIIIQHFIILHFIKGKKNFKTNIGSFSFLIVLLIVSLFCSHRMLFFFNLPEKQLIFDQSTFLSSFMRPTTAVAFENGNVCLTYLDLFFTAFPVTSITARIMTAKTVLNLFKPVFANQTP